MKAWDSNVLAPSGHVNPGHGRPRLRGLRPLHLFHDLDSSDTVIVTQPYARAETLVKKDGASPVTGKLAATRDHCPPPSGPFTILAMRR